MPEGWLKSAVCSHALKQRSADHEGERFVTVPGWIRAQVWKVKNAPQTHDQSDCWETGNSPSHRSANPVSHGCWRATKHSLSQSGWLPVFNREVAVRDSGANVTF